MARRLRFLAVLLSCVLLLSATACTTQTSKRLVDGKQSSLTLANRATTATAQQPGLAAIAAPAPQLARQPAPVASADVPSAPLAPDYATAAQRPRPVMVAAPVQPLPGDSAPAAMPVSAAQGSAYTLGTGDRLRVTVFGEPELSGEFDVDSIGKISMPLIGDVPVMGLTISQASNSIVQKLVGGYLKDPKVSIDVMNYRPFFILGEVLKPGSYPSTSNLTVVNAVAMAGGYTYRADKDDITIVRANDPRKTEQKIGETGTVMPGDVLRVPERFF